MYRKGLVDSLCQVIDVQQLSTARRERRPETGYSECTSPGVNVHRPSPIDMNKNGDTESIDSLERTQTQTVLLNFTNSRCTHSSVFPPSVQV